MKRRVVITGIGVVTCVGTSKETFWVAIIKGKSGIKKISFFDPTTYKTQIAGEIREFDPLQFIDLKGPRYVQPMAIPTIMYNAIACNVSRRYGLMGHGYTVATACTSGANAIGEAYRLIKHGYADVMVTGGTEATISPGIWSGW